MMLVFGFKHNQHPLLCTYKRASWPTS